MASKIMNFLFFLLCISTSLNPAKSFITVSSWGHIHSISYVNFHSKSSRAIIILSNSSEESSSRNNDNDREDDDDNKTKWKNKEEGYNFMKDFQNAKQKKMGAPIEYECTEEAETAAEISENDFLAAMKQVKKDFKEAKEEVGTDEAINLLKNQWDMEDRLKDVNDVELDESGEFN